MPLGGRAGCHPKGRGSVSAVPAPFPVKSAHHPHLAPSFPGVPSALLAEAPASSYTLQKQEISSLICMCLIFISTKRSHDLRLFGLRFLPHHIPAPTEAASIPPLLPQISVSTGFWVNNKITQAGTCSDDFFFLLIIFIFSLGKPFPLSFTLPAREFKGTCSQTGAGQLSTPTLATLREGAAQKLAAEHLCKYSFGIC